jgi:hypothetical protein
VNQAHGRRGAQRNIDKDTMIKDATTNKKDYVGPGHFKTIQRIR